MKSSLTNDQGRPLLLPKVVRAEAKADEVNLTRAQSWRGGPKQRHREI